MSLNILKIKKICPSYGKSEDKNKTCGNCHYSQKEEYPSFKDWNKSVKASYFCRILSDVLVQVGVKMVCKNFREKDN